MTDPQKPRAIIVHSAAQARAVLVAARAAGCRPFLLSAPGAAGFLGAEAFAAMAAAAAEGLGEMAAVPVLDCAEAPGHALAALRAGIRVVRLDAPQPARRRVADIARQLGARLIGTADIGPLLDLLDEADPELACRVFLGAAAAGQENH